MKFELSVEHMPRYKKSWYVMHNEKEGGTTRSITISEFYNRIDAENCLENIKPSWRKYCEKKAKDKNLLAVFNDLKK